MLYMLRIELRAELLAGDPAVGVPVVHLLQQTQPPPQNGVILRRGEESRSHGHWETGYRGPTLHLKYSHSSVLLHMSRQSVQVATRGFQILLHTPTHDVVNLLHYYLSLS